MAQLIFYSESTLYEVERIRVPMEHYKACTIVNESAAYRKGHEKSKDGKEKIFKGFKPDVCDTEEESETEAEEEEGGKAEGEGEKRSDEVQETVQEDEAGGEDAHEEADVGPRYFFAVFYAVE